MPLLAEHKDLPGLYATDLDAVEREARHMLTDAAFSYVAAGAGSGATVEANRAAFARWGIVPRVLRDVSGHQPTTVLGATSPGPVLLAPVGALRLIHPDGEHALARAARELGIPFVLSAAASVPLEHVAETNGPGDRWYELVWTTDEAVNDSQIERARAHGYTVLVISVDLPMVGWRPRHHDVANLPFLEGIGTENLAHDPAFLLGLDGKGDERAQVVRRWAEIMTDPTRTWDDLAHVRDRWDAGPIVLKGIQHVDDALRAVEAGMDGIVVSNHGGRQVDGALGALHALPSIADAVRTLTASAGLPKTTILFDSGIRSGADIIKAVALGADAVLLGRPWVYGLGAFGPDGIGHVVRSILADYGRTLGNAGYANAYELTRAAVREVS
ncbi:alpha-hydroxy-acid oxidizing protein [Amycolatopsis anabasis]|uniref:alpha-hydroxy-acid oxidizing protein n=1 Tax=Amycolatopsis anabasis TaxID=1840409 RepID=UPI00131D3132|nr:alpha-hydroxy-acid oxidizing protein [Amycolatopsis anabasis]